MPNKEPEPKNTPEKAHSSAAMTPDEIYRLESLKQRYSLLKVVFGTAMVGVVTAALPFIIQISKLSFDTEISRRDFVSNYINILERDPQAQIALVEYFAHVLPERSQRSLWVGYRDHLAVQYAKLDQKQRELAKELQTQTDSDKIRRLEDEVRRLQQQVRPIVTTTPVCSSSRRFDLLSAEYDTLFSTMTVSSSWQDLSNNFIDYMVANKERYATVAKATEIPWYVIAIFHVTESSSNFSVHLHNGDPLNARTVHSPKNRPPDGNPPFSWEESAIDALQYYGLTDNTDWSVARILFLMESANGFGYRTRQVCSPYIWSGSNYYTVGKFVADGVFDGNVVSKQIGAAVLLRTLIDRGEIDLRR